MKGREPGCVGRLGPRLGRAVRGRVLVYYFVAGVVDENRALSRASTLASLGFAVAAVVFLLRIFL